MGPYVGAAWAAREFYRARFEVVLVLYPNPFLGE